MRFVIEQYYRVLRFLVGSLLGLMIVPVLLQIISRYTVWVPRFMWTEEVARFCLVWVIMIGSMIAVRDSTHFEVDLFAEPESNRQKGIAKLVVHLTMALAALVFAWYGIQFARFGFIQTSEMCGINMLSIYISFPLAGLTWLLFLVEKIIDDVQLILNADEPEDSSSLGNPV